MTGRPPHDSSTDHPAMDDAAKAAEPSGPATPEPTRPRPSPTSRARRVAAAPEGLRRPSPRPAPTAAAGGASAAGPAAATATTDTKGANGVASDESAAGYESTTGAEGAVAGQDADSLDAQPAELVSRQPSAAEQARRAPAWLAAVLAVLLLALAGLDGWLLTSQPTSGSRTERDQALSTAKSAVPKILSYDYRRFDSDVSAAKAQLTGRAVTDYVQAMTTTIKPTATKVQAVVRAQTDGAGVEAVSSNGTQVTVVVFGEQKVTNTALKAPRTDLFRVRVTLDRVQGQWLVSKFDQI